MLLKKDTLVQVFSCKFYENYGLFYVLLMIWFTLMLETQKIY